MVGVGVTTQFVVAFQMFKGYSRWCNQHVVGHISEAHAQCRSSRIALAARHHDRNIFRPALYDEWQKASRAKTGFASFNVAGGPVQNHNPEFASVYQYHSAGTIAVPASLSLYTSMFSIQGKSTVRAASGFHANKNSDFSALMQTQSPPRFRCFAVYRA